MANITPQEVAELAARAPQFTLASAETDEHGECVCPTCDGTGDVELRRLTNMDGMPVGVEFFGIGPEFGALQAFVERIHDMAALIAEQAAEIERLRECLMWLQALHHGGLMRAKIDEALIRGKALNNDAMYEARAEAACSMGVGCGTAGACYADRTGRPELCGLRISWAEKERRPCITPSNYHPPAQEEAP